MNNKILYHIRRTYLCLPCFLKRASPGFTFLSSTAHRACCSRLWWFLIYNANSRAEVMLNRAVHLQR